MSVDISAYVNVSERLRELGCEIPTGFAILPANFESAVDESEFRNVKESATLKTLLRISKLPFQDIVGPERRIPHIHNRSAEWMAPTIFVASSLLTQNPEYASLMLDAIQKYLIDFFEPVLGARNAKLEIVVETQKGGTCKKIHFEGPPEAIKDLAKVIEAAVNE